MHCPRIQGHRLVQDRRLRGNRPSLNGLRGSIVIQGHPTRSMSNPASGGQRHVMQHGCDNPLVSALLPLPSSSTHPFTRSAIVETRWLNLTHNEKRLANGWQEAFKRSLPRFLDGQRRKTWSGIDLFEGDIFKFSLRKGDA